MVESKGWLGEIQGGFREDRGTMDNLFILTQIIAEAKKQKKKLHLGFVDFRKAYDTVNRTELWQSLKEKGIGEKTIRLIRSLYEGHRRKVKTVNGYTDWIDCEVGLKQGCVLSPLLFALYISDLGDQIRRQGGGIDIGTTKIAALFFADDIVLVAADDKELQQQLALLQEFTKEKKLEINYKKTEIMKFTKEEKWQWAVLDAKKKVIGEIEETEIYKYLGLRISRKNTRAQLAAEKVQGLNRRVGMLKGMALGATDVAWAGDVLWRQAVKPGLLYGAEIIPYKKQWIEEVEKAQRKVGRWILGVGMSANERKSTLTLSQELVVIGNPVFHQLILRVETSDKKAALASN
jgi:hypothetical protein